MGLKMGGLGSKPKPCLVSIISTSRPPSDVAVSPLVEGLKLHACSRDLRRQKVDDQANKYLVFQVVIPKSERWSEW